MQLGVRPPRPSSDVDVLCEPMGVKRLGMALQSCGWRRRTPESFTKGFEHASAYMFEHSVHYIHDEWPCDLDIHFNFPGFLAPDEVVFEELWARRITVTIANMSVPAADPLGQAAVIGLHALRDARASHERDLEHLLRVLRALPQADQAVMSQLAAVTGASETLRPVLQSAGILVQPSAWAESEALRRWGARTENAGTYTTTWILELRATPWRRKPLVVWRAVFLPKDVLMSSHVGQTPHWRNVTRFRVKRWLRAARHLRRGVAAAKRTESGQ